MAAALAAASPVGVEGDHGRQAGRQRGRRHDRHLAVAHGRRLLGGEHDVAVVGQHDDLGGVEALDGGDELGGARVHGLAAVDHGLAAELAKERLVALAGGDGHAGHPLVEAQAALAGARLLAHVGDLDVVDRAVRRGVAEHGARVVGVHVDLEHALAAHDERAVALRADEALEVVVVEVVAEQQEARAVAEARLLDVVGRGCRRRAARRARGGGRCRRR